MEHREDLTQLMYRMATSQTLGLRQALDLLREEAYVRPVRETLARYANKSPNDTKTLRTFLVEKLLEQSPEGTRWDFVDRKVRMWMEDGAQAISKPGAIQVSFALGLSVEEANAFLQRVCGEGIHSRDPEEIIFLYAMKKGMSYQKALALQTDMENKGVLEQKKSGEEGLLTAIVRQGLDSLEGVDDLEAFLRGYQGRLGSFHNTAYKMLKEYLKLLTDTKLDDEQDDKKKENKNKKKDEEDEEGHMSIREVTDVYLHEKLIPRIQRTAKKNPEAGNLVLSALQRNIKQNWPDETTLSKMMNRKMDVSRKVLVLLFLATDGGLDDEYEYEEEEEEVFEDAYSRMNGMLVNCGFAPLDPRCAFDWMVLYCMCVDAEDSLLIDSRIHRFLEEIFQPPREEG
ncbi:MAG: hypothetical protein K2N78_06120 [Oscillospiraceae bacterium]|nr:hypothetical protein [Oscillospiraceae bacterium]